MRKDLLLSPWTVRHTGTEIQNDFPESIFFTGNGRMGVRGYLPCGREALPVKTGLYVTGIFGQIKPGITDFVNLPSTGSGPLFPLLLSGSLICAPLL